MPRLNISKDGVKKTEKRELNFVEGENVTITITDGEQNDAADITIASAAGGATDHGALTGLADDDHTQYAHLSQAETFTEAITFNISGTDRFRVNSSGELDITPVNVNSGINIVGEGTRLHFTSTNVSSGIRIDDGSNAILFRLARTAGGLETITFGSAEDVNLYRSAADTLKTDDSVVVVGTIKQSTTKDVLDTDHTAAADPHTGYLQESLADAQGDLLVASGADAWARLPIGAVNGDVLTSNGTTASWQTPGAGSHPVYASHAKFGTD
jgi:hypothetical protein